MIARGNRRVWRAGELVEPEIWPVDKVHIRSRTHEIGVARHVVNRAAGHRDPLLKMQFARAAVIEQAVGDVRILLDFDHRNACADGVDGIGRNVEEIAGRNLVPHQHILDAAIQRGGAHRFGVNRFAKPDPQGRARFSRDHQPAFFLALLAQPGGLRLRIRRVALDRKFFRGEDIFHQQLRQFSRRFEPDFTDPCTIGRSKRSGQHIAAPYFFDSSGGQQHACLRFRPAPTS